MSNRAQKILNLLKKKEYDLVVDMLFTKEKQGVFSCEKEKGRWNYYT